MASPLPFINKGGCWSCGFNLNCANDLYFYQLKQLCDLLNSFYEKRDGETKIGSSMFQWLLVNV